MNKKKLVTGIFFWIFLALLMVRDIKMLITSDLFGFFVSFCFGLFFSYYIVAYLFGWDMINYGGGLIKKGEHDFARAMFFVIFICFWMWSFFCI